MPQEPMLNQRIVLVSRPHGAPTAEGDQTEQRDRQVDKQQHGAKTAGAVDEFQCQQGFSP